MPDLSNVENSVWMEFLKNDVLYLVKLTKEDLRMIEEDPVEYIRSQNDPILVSVRKGAADLIDESCSISKENSKKKTCVFINAVMSMIHTNLQNCLLLEQQNKTDIQLKESMIFII